MNHLLLKITATAVILSLISGVVGAAMANDDDIPNWALAIPAVVLLISSTVLVGCVLFAIWTI